MSQTYYAVRNLKHNGNSYQRGDEIVIDEKFAASLLEDNAISLDSVSAEPEASVETAPETASDQPSVGGEPDVTGEPSIDGEETPAQKPNIVQRMFGGGDSTQEPEAPKGDEAPNAPETPAAPETAPQAPETEQRDPSANL